MAGDPDAPPPRGIPPHRRPLEAEVARVEVDARDLRCPLPVIRLAEAVRHAEPGTEILVRSTDPAARADIPAWCRLRSQELLEVREEDGHTVHVVRVSPGRR